MSRGGFRQLKLLQTASQWQQACQARSSKSILLSQTDVHADAQLNRYRDYLGHEFESVFLDCHNGINADAICALCGTVIGGGQLIIYLPHEPSAMRERLHYFANKYFPQNQLQKRQKSTSQKEFDDAIVGLQTLQKELIDEAFSKNPIHTHIIIAERGRGKSTLLGKVLSQVSNASPNVDFVVTAPRKANAQVLLKNAPNTTFKAWDKLLEQPSKEEKWLIIDEAAGIPLWATEQLCEKFTPWLLATTVSGYEGCGRGFAIHFQDWAKQEFLRVKSHQLNTPMRWPLNDPLEQWLTDCFLMDESPVLPDPGLADGQFLEYAADMSESTLRQCFQLLLNAHYQSSPNDLNLLLSDSLHRLAYTRKNGEIIAVAWLIQEGPLAPELHTGILEGRRRPKGNLLPQAIGYFLQQPWALSARWLRVARIAVPEHERHKGNASQLLDFIAQHPKHSAIDKFGTSFAWEPGVANFWETNGFVPWRISHRLDSVSARPAAIYVKTASSDNASIHDIHQWAHAEHQWLSESKACIPDDLNQPHLAQLLVDAYLKERIPFDAAHFALAVFYKNKRPTDRLTTLLAMPTLSLKELASYLGCSSKQQANVKLRKDTAQLV
ncbi:tRNA(Met) cytidine acetyltransferase [Idiomarina sp. 29L]|uniref:GNAT family N-acetyltransferase n=1 Tax=Idiomarina sp. 29L TaxID=2508877 RepID=UPI001012375B|nr:GNAT family N-acetyltransferase [Idiomarina sp. 29L]RXS42391.1 tRNA(Met) cytidine acetyltransferase [Idiomarina sp. 29L]